MCKVQMLRALVKQRLAAAAEDIFGLFERTITEYEEELSGTREENERQRKLLDAVLQPQLVIHRVDVQQLLREEDLPPEQQDRSSGLDQEDRVPPHITEEQQDRGSGLDQEDPVPPHKEDQQDRGSGLDQEDPVPPHIKEDQQELWSCQEGEQLQGLEEVVTLVPVTSDDNDEEEAQSSQLHHMGADEEDCGGPGPGPDVKSAPDASVDVAFRTKTRKHQSGFTYQRNKKTSSCSEDLKAGPETQTNPDPSGPHRVNSDPGCNIDMKPFSSSTCEDIHTLPTHRKSPAGGKPPGCSLPAPAAGHVTEEEAFSCSVCHTGHRDSESLVQHMRIHTRQTQFRCSVCGEEFTWRRVLTKHMEAHKIYSCSVCAQKFTSLWQKTNHKCVDRRSSQLHRRHSNPDNNHEEPSEPDTVDSNDCQETRDPQSALKTSELPDLRCRTGKNPFSCSVCKKSFWQIGHLKDHILTHTGEKPHSCSVCKKSFRQIGHLKGHMLTHTGEKSHSCSVCKKYFTMSGSLKNHMLTHAGAKPHSCSVCKKNLTTSGSLKNHMLTHTGEKPHSCSVCKKSFAQSGALARHMLIHKGVKSHNCSACKKIFTLKANLKRHMLTHTGERPHSCSVCKMSFTQSGALKRHMQTHTAD